MKNWAKSWMSAVNTLRWGISGSSVPYIIEPHPKFISSKVISPPSLAMLSQPQMKGLNSFSSNLGMVMMGAAGLGTAGKPPFRPPRGKPLASYFCIIVRSS